jgi:hypothetical protein
MSWHDDDIAKQIEAMCPNPDDLPPALKRDKNNVAPFMVTKPSTVDFFHETPRVLVGVDPAAPGSDRTACWCTADGCPCGDGDEPCPGPDGRPLCVNREASPPASLLCEEVDPGSMEAVPLCEDEGCPHCGTPHVCVNREASPPASPPSWVPPWGSKS